MVGAYSERKLSFPADSGHISYSTRTSYHEQMQHGQNIIRRSLAGKLLTESATVVELSR